jgi:hypothetical protein
MPQAKNREADQETKWLQLKEAMVGEQASKLEFETKRGTRK